MFENVQPGPVDPMFLLKKAADADTSKLKVDLGVGIYRNEHGLYHELKCIQQAKTILQQQNPGHDYELTVGNGEFLSNAAAVVFGKKALGAFAQNDQKVTSVQTISGTGANHLAAVFLQRSMTSPSRVFVGTPTWGNYEPLCRLAGFEIVKYKYYDQENARVDFTSVLEAVENAPEESIFILQACCQNPTGADLTREQWEQLAATMKRRGLFPFFDIAYQGLGVSLDDDAYAIRLFFKIGFEMVVCQSFSKNFGLYGERCGVLHVVSKDSTTAANIQDQLRCLIRWEFSSSPAFGSRLVTIILSDAEMTDQWIHELHFMRARLNKNRQKLYDLMVKSQKTSGGWRSITNTSGLFCFLPITAAQCAILRSDYHIYLPDSGRINVAGLNNSNVDYVASAIDAVVRDS